MIKLVVNLALMSAVLWGGVATAQQGETPTPEAPGQQEPAGTSSPQGIQPFTPPPESEIPDDEFGAMVRRGKALFMDSQQMRGTYVNNGLTCANCHLDRGRKPNSSPMWGAWTMYPAYRGKTGRVDTMAERIQGCFEYSMNGKAPPVGSEELTALMTYFYWMSTGAPTRVELPGRGYPEVPKPAQEPDPARGEQVFAAQCAICHGEDGQGRKVGDQYVFPPLWGEESYNWGAGMHRINTAAAFIKHNMPLGQGGTLSDQEAWDVASYMNSHERPQDPRFTGDLAETDKTFHDEQCHYGEEMHGKVLGGS